MHRRMTESFVVLAIVMISATASAQMGKEGKGQSGMMGEGMMGGGMMSGGMGMGMHGPGMEMGGMGEMMKMMGAVAKMDLTADQKKKLQLLTLQHQKEAIPLLGQIRTAGVEIQELLLTDHVNVEKIKSKVKEKYDASAKLEINHLALIQDVKKILTPEQRQQMESMMMQMGPMMGSMPMMESMMGASSGAAAKGEQAPNEAPSGPAEGATESKDPHGH